MMSISEDDIFEVEFVFKFISISPENCVADPTDKRVRKTIIRAQYGTMNLIWNILKTYEKFGIKIETK